MQMTLRKGRKHQAMFQLRVAFTLTELLVVIAIIAVLAALVSVAVLGALDTAKQTRIKAEIDQIDLAIKSFKEKYGAYPPFDLRPAGSAPWSNTERDRAIMAFVARAFPRYYDITQAPNDIRKNLDTTNQRPDQALVFWLNGFNLDPTRPFLNVGNQMALPKAMRTPPFFDFDISRLKPLGPVPPPPGAGELQQAAPSYIPPGSKKDVPYLYFDLATLKAPGYPVGGAPDVTTYNWLSTYANLPDAGFAWPYCNDNNANNLYDVGTDDWVNLESYQIIAPGLDDSYSRVSTTPQVHLFPTGTGYDPMGSEDDNVTNFCQKARLGDAKP